MKLSRQLSVAVIAGTTALALGACGTMENMVSDELTTSNIATLAQNSGARALCRSVISSSDHVREARGPCSRAVEAAIGEGYQRTGIPYNNENVDLVFDNDLNTDKSEERVWETMRTERGERRHFQVRDERRCLGASDRDYANMFGRSNPGYCVGLGYGN